MIYLQRGRVVLPRQPNSIASVLAYIHQSKMLDDFVVQKNDAATRTELLTSKEMTKYLKGFSENHGLGWYVGRDRRDHLSVDEEPLLANYRSGADWRDGRVTKVGGWEEYWLTD